ncbi:ATP-binding protein [Pseudoxanthomonas wuyuanensis]|uniref:histidine kinase n=1 Tax=Pseudoxanthomonas wuyuanensis TaxID=1073196 RepID=A0A286D9M6_9GAMM|nr:ATP-binding protein [Pseudoxanthomonas wuyuanensis]SOD55359.1 two-component system, OmpR family, osmolarity sensor histidine kinase EnvZ [Pseudoxanthomonas wuyuanensis]
MRLPLPRSLFGQLALVIGLVLTGAGVLALLLGRELATRPAAEQMLRAMQGFADVVEALDRHQPHAQTVRQLREAGLEVRESAPPEQRPRLAPLIRELREQAQGRLGPGRELRVARSGRTNEVWLKLHTREPLWVSFTHERRGAGVRRFSALLLLGCVALVWLAAAYFARRLVLPLRRLAQAAPAIARGDPPPPSHARDPREVAELAQALDRASCDVRAAAEERAFLLAGISHDLRTPLTRVQYAMELLPGTDPELRLGIQRDIDEIDAILSQFITYARDGRDESSEALDLAEICRNALAASPASWDAELPASAPLHGKPMALLRAVENLIVNAQRHAAPPFALRLWSEGDAWVVEVSDHGPGLGAEAAERALQPFVHDSGQGGSGLGLPIVERVARQHGGSLQLLPNGPHGLLAVLRLRGA